ncbi:DUF2155 domain-containing protein [Paracoccus sp. MBLB3053]|uniref:DUF2155 domain-containing protein n=1 Tax=Paracoccus aurantius TaxID=3073814 RepID=A0ABU2HTE3_9RHOB|nr:DUF2155 domain-containing protein [Paracoccus sp. MBLB3053]MDS9468318.1 DUF2155 domain-containing protein [Paracoccus sp. MBLB3053]
MIRNLAGFLLCAALCCSPALGQEDTQPEEDLTIDPALSSDPNAVVVAEPSAAEREAAIAAARGPQTRNATGALLRGLDKVTGQTIDFEMETGQASTFGRLELRLSECRYPAADPTSDSYAEVTVTDQRANRIVFSGWLIASSPALSAVDDPRYDVWVMSCSRT